MHICSNVTFRLTFYKTFFLVHMDSLNQIECLFQNKM